MKAALALLLALATAGIIGLIKAYGHVSIHELRSRAREGDELSAALFRVSAYGGMLFAMLWLLAGVFGAWFFILIDQVFDGGMAILVGALFIITTFIWLRSREVSKLSLQIAGLAAPALAWVLEHSFSLFEPVERLAVRYLPGRSHTGIYDIDDLLDVLEAQRRQPDSRINHASLDIAINALTFNYRRVGEIMVPLNSIRTLSTEDVIGPVTMSELHESGQTLFPVFEGEHDHIVGTLSLIDLVDSKKDGPVKELMQPKAFYLHEDQSLQESLNEILRPNRQLFIVVNDFEEVAGVVTSEMILRQIVGNPEAHELAKYEEVEELQNGDQLLPDKQTDPQISEEPSSPVAED